MKIKMASNALILAFLWIIVAILNITIVIILHSNRSFLAVIAPRERCNENLENRFNSLRIQERQSG